MLVGCEDGLAEVGGKDGLAVVGALVVGELVGLRDPVGLEEMLGESDGEPDGLSVVKVSEYTRTSPLPSEGAPTANKLPSPESETAVPKFSPALIPSSSSP